MTTSDQDRQIEELCFALGATRCEAIPLTDAAERPYRVNFFDGDRAIIAVNIDTDGVVSGVEPERSEAERS